MIRARWLEKREPYWKRLEIILEHSGRRGLAALPAHELQEAGLLYRQVASDLATLRENPDGARRAAYLNQLLGRTHNLIYAGRGVERRGLLRFYGQEFPQVFRETLPYSMAAVVLFLAGAVVGCLAALADPAFQRAFLGRQMTETIDRGRMWTESIVTIQPLASSSIMTNNLTVSFMAFALGITGGLGTIYLLLTNGLLIGVIGAACWQAGMSLRLWSFVAPHGVLELPAIFLAAGGGLLIARGLLFPGMMSRRDALTYYGGLGVRLTVGIIPMLVVAGVIEGFVSPSQFPAGAKFLLAISLAGLLVLYLGCAGRRDTEARSLGHPGLGS